MEIKESFFKGINRAITREQFYDPDFFWSTQNARVLQDGRIGEVVRIKGFSKVNTQLDDVVTIYDMVVFNDNFIVFYDNGMSYQLKIFDNTGTLVDEFSYTDDIVPEWGELKQHENTIFIAPHNKLLFFNDGSFFLKDFISDNTFIKEISLDDLSAVNAEYDLRIDNTIAAYPGRKARGIIKVYRNTLPVGVTDTFQIQIGADLSDVITLSSTSTTGLILAILNAINTSASFNTKWSAERDGNDIIVFSENTGTANNDVEISLVGSEYLKDENVTDGYRLGDGGWQFSGETTTRDGITIVRGGGAAGFADDSKVAMAFTNTFGGLDNDTIVGSLSVTLRDAIATSEITITSADTTTDIATKIEEILNESDAVTNNYTISRAANVITITAKEAGKKGNTEILLTLNTKGNLLVELPDNFYSISRKIDGVDANSQGTLSPNTNYWYRGRIRYIDGHITTTTSPRLINSGANGFVSVVFNIDQEDLDGTLPKLQIFRKEEGFDFFLIREIDLDQETIVGGEFTFIDTGYSNIQPFNERINVWTKQHKTQEVIENRFIKGNVTFFNEGYTTDSGDYTFSTIANPDVNDVAPYNSKVDFFVRPQFTDGTLGYFTEVGSLNIDTTKRQLQVQQTGLVTSNEKDISELRFYGKYAPFGEEQNLKFNTIEIQTPSLSSIADPTIFPSQTKVFYGFKEIITVTANSVTRAFVAVEDWATNETPPYRFIGEVKANNTNRGGLKLNADNILEANIHGNVKKYIPIARYTTTDSIPVVDSVVFTIYKLEEFEALKEAVSTGELKVRLNRGNRQSLSSIISDDELYDSVVNVTGIEDKTFDNLDFPIVKSNNVGLFDRVLAGIYKFKQLLPNKDSRIYLILEDSKLNEIDNNNINRRSYKGGLPPRSGQIELDVRPAGTVAFDIINFEKAEEPTFNFTDTRVVKTDNGDYDLLNIVDAKYSLINKNLNKDNLLIYFGKKLNALSTVTFDTTGFSFKERSSLFYSRFAEYNLYETLITESDFNRIQTEFQNQLIWSDTLLLDDYFSGGRNFDVTNFYNIPNDNGEIIDIVSLAGNLYVFCERGVARLLIGETLTQQKSGEVFVSSSTFISRHIWILENLNNIKRDTIKKIDNRLYFTDGNTVYSIGQDGIQDISKGLFVVNSADTYVATHDVKYDEYRLSNVTTGETFVYNTKYGIWYGAFTFIPEKSVWIGGKTFSFITALMEEDTGNTFNGTAFTTILQSVGNDTEIASVDKRYRKFYFSADGVFDFKYGKDYTDMETRASADIIVKNGYYNVGVVPTESNTRKIYWDIESTDANFALNGFEVGYNLTRRR